MPFMIHLAHKPHSSSPPTGINQVKTMQIPRLPVLQEGEKKNLPRTVFRNKKTNQGLKL